MGISLFKLFALCHFLLLVNSLPILPSPSPDSVATLPQNTAFSLIRRTTPLLPQKRPLEIKLTFSNRPWIIPVRPVLYELERQRLELVFSRREGRFHGFESRKDHLRITFEVERLPPDSTLNGLTNSEAGLVVGTLQNRLRAERIMSEMDFEVELGRVQLGKGVVLVVS